MLCFVVRYEAAYFECLPDLPWNYGFQFRHKRAVEHLLPQPFGDGSGVQRHGIFGLPQLHGSGICQHRLPQRRVGDRLEWTDPCVACSDGSGRGDLSALGKDFQKKRSKIKKSPPWGERIYCNGGDSMSTDGRLCRNQENIRNQLHRERINAVMSHGEGV